jgi:hypothetical protein
LVHGLVSVVFSWQTHDQHLEHSLLPAQVTTMECEAWIIAVMVGSLSSAELAPSQLPA